MKKSFVQRSFHDINISSLIPTQASECLFCFPTTILLDLYFRLSARFMNDLCREVRFVPKVGQITVGFVQKVGHILSKGINPGHFYMRFQYIFARH